MGKPPIRRERVFFRPFAVFRLVLVVLGVLTVLDSSHVVRYSLCGVLVAILGAEVLRARHAKEQDSAQHRHGP